MTIIVSLTRFRFRVSSVSGAEKNLASNKFYNIQYKLNIFAVFTHVHIFANEKRCLSLCLSDAKQNLLSLIPLFSPSPLSLSFSPCEIQRVLVWICTCYLKRGRTTFCYTFRAQCDQRAGTFLSTSGAMIRASRMHFQLSMRQRHAIRS